MGSMSRADLLLLKPPSPHLALSALLGSQGLLWALVQGLG